MTTPVPAVHPGTSAPARRALSLIGNPCLFIVGCLRSGTTMFRHVVDAHPQVAIVNETQWVPRRFEQRSSRTGLTDDGLISRHALPELLAFDRFARLDVRRAEVEAWLAAGPLPYQEFVRRIFDAHGRANGKAIVGEKSPGYVRHLPTLCALWPEARVVHLIRDGRDVYLSLASWQPEKQARTIGRFATWAAEPAITAALWWEWHVRLGLEAADRLGPGRYHQLRYEDLVADPTGECQRLCAFLGVPYDDAMLRFHEQHRRPGDPPPRRGPALPVTPGLRDWRTQLDPTSQQEFEAVAGELLGQLGYDHTASDATMATLARVEAVRDAFEPQASVQRRHVPDWGP